MGRKRYTPEQIISMLREIEVLQIQGSKMAERSKLVPRFSCNCQKILQANH